MRIIIIKKMTYMRGNDFKLNIPNDDNDGKGIYSNYQGPEDFEMKPLLDGDNDDISLKDKKGTKRFQWNKHDYDPDDDGEEETSFGGRVVNTAKNLLKPSFSDGRYRKISVFEFEDGSIGAQADSVGRIEKIINSVGEISTRISTRLRKLLGESFHEKLQRNRRLNDEALAEQNRLLKENIEDQASFDLLNDNLDSNHEVRDKINKRILERYKRIEEIQYEIDDRNKEDKNTTDKLPIRQRIKQSL